MAATVVGFTATQITVTVPGGAQTGPVTVTAAGGSVSTATNFTVVPPPPVITVGPTLNGQVGVAFSYQISATNVPTGYRGTGLPAGLFVDAASGLVFGTPTAAGTFTATVTATNAGGHGFRAADVKYSSRPARR